MNCINIVKNYLKDNEYDGLYQNGECACKIDDLAPCESDFATCEPGYIQPGDSEYDFYIGPTKPVNQQINPDLQKPQTD